MGERSYIKRNNVINIKAFQRGTFGAQIRGQKPDSRAIGLDGTPLSGQHSLPQWLAGWPLLARLESRCPIAFSLVTTALLDILSQQHTNNNKNIFSKHARICNLVSLLDIIGNKKREMATRGRGLIESCKEGIARKC